MTELLAPAGNMEALRAAIANGADAVYVGGKSFSARAFAGNFDDEELAEAVRLVHFHGKKIYLAINTLIADNEMEEALRYMKKVYEMGIDAAIIQDAGLWRLLRKALPDLPLHASTQMTVHNSCGAEFCRREGMERVILSRELSFDDIRSIRKNVDVELESFIHGALCVCYSGQCLFSSMIGGRSGNRGRCAQPCRLAYQIIDEKKLQAQGKKADKTTYLLSPKDLVGFPQIEELHDLGLASWKIEGRMKKPEYVATVCSVYSKYKNLLDARRIIYPEKEDLRKMLQMFNRDHCTGYWQGNLGADMISPGRPSNRGMFLGRIIAANRETVTLKLEQPLFAGDGIEVWVNSGGREGFTIDRILVNGKAQDSAQIGDEVELQVNAGRPGDRIFKTFDRPLAEAVRDSYAALGEKQLSFVLRAKIGEQLFMSATDEEGYYAEYTAEYVVQQALTSDCDWANVRAQLSRLGGTGYVLADLDGELDEEVMLPASVLNGARRALVADINEQRRLAHSYPPADDTLFAEAVTDAQTVARQKKGAAKPVVLVDDLEKLRSCLKAGIKDFYWPMQQFRGVKRVDYSTLLEVCAERGAEIALMLPRIIGEFEQERVVKDIQLWQECGGAAVVIEQAGQKLLLEQAGFTGRIFGGSSLNIFNGNAARFYAEQGLERLTLSPEMTLDQLTHLPKVDAEKEFIAAGALELMVSEHCPIGATLGGRTACNKCSAPCMKSNYLLRDDKGYEFPIRTDSSCRMHLFNSRQLNLIGEVGNLQAAGIDRLRLDLRLYPESTARRIAELYVYATSDSWNITEAAEKMELIISEFTKGHLYRGV